MKFDVIKYYTYVSLRFFLFFLPIQVIFFKENNLNMTEIFILMSLASLIITLFEIPTGAIADYFGKKISIISGLLSQSIACFIFFAGSNFWYFLIAYFFWAVGSTLMSGVDVALLFDILHTNKKTELFKKISATSRILALISTSIGAVIGGIIASYSLAATYFITGVAMFLCVVVVLSIKHKEINNKKEKKYFKIISDTFKIIKKNKVLLFLFIYSGIFITVIKLIRPSSQLYFELSGLPIGFFGVAMAYLFLIRAVAARKIDLFEKIFKNKIYWVMSLIMVSSLLIISFFAFKLGFLILGLVFIGMPIINTLIDHDALSITPKDKHATILSFKNQFFTGIGFFAGPIYGFSIDKLGFQQSTLWLSVTLIIIFTITLINIDINKYKKYKNK